MSKRQPLRPPSPLPIKLPRGVTADILPVASSTMDAGRDYTGPIPHWILAERQTAARGRQGRSWVCPEGAFAATLVMNPNAPPDQAALRSFVAACALYAALSEFVAPDLLLHKWPNDVLLDGGKTAGILLEAQQAKAGTVDRLLIGIGVNLGKAPKDVTDAAFAPIGLADIIGVTITPAEFLPPLARAFARFEAQFQTQGFAPIRTAWMNNAARLGQVIRARTAQASYEGRFDGIDAAGNLVLGTDSGPMTISAADVYF